MDLSLTMIDLMHDLRSKTLSNEVGQTVSDTMLVTAQISVADSGVFTQTAGCRPVTQLHRY